MAFGRFWRRLRPPRRLRLTREGRYYIGITIGLGLAAVNTGNNLLYLLLGWLLSTIIASGILSETALRKLKISRRPPPQVFANRPFLMEVSIENIKGHLASYSIEVEDLLGDRPLDKKCYFLKVPAGRTQRTSYRHTFTRRGLYRFDGFRVATQFPFGLFIKSRRETHAGDVIVFPEIKPMPLPSRRARNQGALPVGRIGRRGEFIGLREYRDGDDRRSVHWRSSARAGRMLVREFEEEAQRHATVMLDNGMPANPDAAALSALEEAINMTASLANTYIQNGYAIRLVTRSGVVPFAAGPQQLVRILYALALLPATSCDTPFAASPEPRGDNLLVKAGGVHMQGKAPQGITHVMEAS